jgi:hypothetical protein
MNAHACSDPSPSSGPKIAGVDTVIGAHYILTNARPRPAQQSAEVPVINVTARTISDCFAQQVG